jgi:aminoglycoside phosphotransferase (APT) family kinase protein
MPAATATSRTGSVFDEDGAPVMSPQPDLERPLAQLLQLGWPDADDIRIDDIARIHGGWSKQMYSVDATIRQAGDTVRRALILRINAPDGPAILRNHRLAEHLLLNRLRQHTSLPVPRSLVVDASGTLFGAEAMILERLAGNPKISTIAGNEVSSVAEHLVELLAQLHTAPRSLLNPDGSLDDPQGFGLRTDSWDDYIESSCHAWEQRYRERAFDALPVTYDSFCTMRRSKPRPLPLVVLHGELNPNNLIVDGGRITGIIDWERAHIGDPREDLAWFKYFEEAMAGTSLVAAVQRSGGYLGYYNELTGFGVTEQELAWFTAFSHADVSYGPYSSITRRLAGHHDDIMATYLLAEVILSQHTLTRVLGYRGA